MPQIETTHLDQGSDIVSFARPAIKSAVDWINGLMGYTGTTMTNAEKRAVQDSIGLVGGFRNRIINPQGGIYQRAITATADDTYFADRFYALTESSTVTPSVLLDPEPGYPTGVRLTSNTTQRFGFAQIIEGRNCKDLRGRTAICSPRIRISGTQMIRYAILGWTGTEDVVTSDVVLNWASTSFTPGGFFISANLQVLALGSQSVTANTWTDLPGIFGAMGSTFNNLIVFVWTESQQASGFTLDFDNVDLEPGAIVTPPEFRDVGDELRRCQRYYAVVGADFQTYVQSGFAGLWSVTTPQPLRSSATVTYTTISSTNLASITFNQDYPSSVRALMSPTTANNMVRWIGSVYLSAEL